MMDMFGLIAVAAVALLLILIAVELARSDGAPPKAPDQASNADRPGLQPGIQRASAARTRATSRRTSSNQGASRRVAAPLPVPSRSRPEPRAKAQMDTHGRGDPKAEASDSVGPNQVGARPATLVEARAAYLSAHARLIQAQWAHQALSATDPSALTRDSHPVRVELSAASSALQQARASLAAMSTAELAAANRQIAKARVSRTSPSGLDPDIWEQEAGWRDFRRNWGWQNRRR